MELGVQTHFSQGWNTSLIGKATELGATSIRDSQPWAAVEKTAGAYAYKPALVNYMDKAADAGLGTTLTFSGGNALYGTKLTTLTDAGRQAYADYIVATLSKYGDAVHEIEIWNEFNTSSEAGRNEAYVALLKTVYEKVKPLFPHVEILGGSTNVIGTGAIDAIFKLGAGDYMDGVVVHPYTSAADNLDDQLLHLQSVMGRYGAVKPIYATEFGNEFTDAASAPDLMLKAVTLMSSVHVAKADWYALQDEKFFSNMGLYDAGGAAKPAAFAFAFLEKSLIPLGDAVKVETGDEQTRIFRFGADTYVMWGSARAMTFAADAVFYNSKGEVIARPTGLSDTPFVVKTGTYAIGETKVVADSLLEYGDTSVWQYFAKNAKTGQLTTLTTVDWDWTSYLGSKYTKPLRINDTSLAPAGDGKNPIQAVERYTSDKAQTLRVVGHWDVGTDGDGVDLHILVNGHEIFSRVFTGAIDIADLTVTLAKGDTLDFALGPNQYVQGDSTNRRIQLVAADSPVAAPVPTPVPMPPAPAPAIGTILKGTAGADTLVGGTGDDLFYASAGKDSFSGGGGRDTVSFEKISQGVTIDLSKAGYQTMAHGMSGQFVDIDDMVGSRFADVLGGSAGDNAISAGDGNDLIRASLGTDVIDGGAGTDTLSYANATGGITVSLAAGGMQSSGYGTIMIRGVENLIGGQFDDLIAGNGGDNVLNGGAGTDTVSYADAAAGVTVSLAVTTAQATGGAGTDTLLNVENLTGSAFADILTGNREDNVLIAGAGNDLFYATEGKDQIDGGAGSDTLSFERFGVGVMLDLAKTAAQTVAQGVRYKLVDVENVIGSHFDDTLSGTAAADMIFAGAGNDVVNGRGGADRLDGGEGVDTLSFAGAAQGVSVSLATSAAQETGIGRMTISGFENLTGSARADVLGGDAADNVLRGGSGDDVLSGGLGHNMLDGGAGSDTVSYADAAAGVTVSLAITTEQDTIGAGSDTLTSIENLTGSRLADWLTGGAGNNLLDGGDGDDVLIGWTGRDSLRGGAGADSFVFRAPDETVTASPDRILDFSRVEGDRIDLSQMDAIVATQADDAFRLVNAFTKHAGELTCKASGGGVLVRGDVDGDGVPDFAIQVLGVSKLMAADFIL